MRVCLDVLAELDKSSFYYDNEVATKGLKYLLPDSILRLAYPAELPTTVVQRAGQTVDGLGVGRSNTVTKNYGIGTASFNYGPQQKIIDVELATTKSPFPNISLYTDDENLIYGQTKKDAGGHVKPYGLYQYGLPVTDWVRTPPPN